MNYVVIIPDRYYTAATRYIRMYWNPKTASFSEFLNRVRTKNRLINNQLSRDNQRPRIFSRILRADTGETVYINPLAAKKHRESPQSKHSCNTMYLR